jgi:uncharacterized membrane protein (UPF0127 family)
VNLLHATDLIITFNLCEKHESFCYLFVNSEPLVGLFLMADFIVFISLFFCDDSHIYNIHEAGRIYNVSLCL